MLYCFCVTLFIKLFTKIISFPSPDNQFNDVKKSAIKSLKIIIVEILLTLLYVLIVDNSIKNISGLGIFFLQSSFYFLLTTIVILAVFHEKESLQSIGITKLNLIKSCILGIFLGVITVLVANQGTLRAGQTLNIMAIASLISFIKYTIVGFSEEIIFRGYFQTRLITFLGGTKGCLITAVIFSFYHLPANMVFNGMDLQAAFIKSFNYIPLSLVLGYIMIKTKNITSVSILHTFIDWS
jgi:hypothetical protein